MKVLEKSEKRERSKELIRAVIDTNIIVRAFLLHPQKPKSHAREMIKLFLEKQPFVWLWSEDVINEYKETLLNIGQRKDILKKGYKVDLDLAQIFISTLYVLGEKVKVSAHSLGEARKQISDPDDSHFLATALDGRADIITTGDSDIYKLGSHYKQIKILSLQQFLKKIKI